ncbi:RES family NAD+ phosphorylase [Rhizobium laguerreae]|uniref:RES family NAD+ phosphorylase n=1 Tax=Rhizobium laguerreae TaxID=1076926 RepID=UPI001C91A3A0|nr:RES family NAD+ phosphorylase [Rhizobium laguerreae]MBY3243450.1 RES family NAD+ phosphorylase [Rhizobium laguerreae]MBY3526770.1 RES family NAD+ phosphorylase [Rhizobium laguerreae]
MPPVDLEEIKKKRLCSGCVGEQYLSDEIRREGKRRRCSYCDITRKTYSIEQVADRIEAAFAQHYERTSDQPDDFESMMLRDREINYDWQRHGQPVVEAIGEAAEIEEEPARDLQSVLEERHADIELEKIGEEAEFGDETYYDLTGVSDAGWQQEWQRFETSLKTVARFFSREAARHLSSVFDGIDKMTARNGRPLLVRAGPGKDIGSLFRARVFQSDDKLTESLCRPDLHLGSPPSLFASAGRMNARGISVFYGASDPKAAIAEVRPPVGSQVAVAEFEIIRELVLLDLTALGKVSVEGSIFDHTLAGRRERASFLRSLSRRITRPVMPDDEPFDYLTTQAVADFLATETNTTIEGIIYPSVQVANVLNVVLFHKAALVEKIELPDGTRISAHTGQDGGDGWEDDYAVFERVPPAKPKVDLPSGLWLPNLAKLAQVPWSAPADDSSLREPTLRIILNSVVVHQIKRVSFDTDEFSVRRHRWEDRDEKF